MDNGFAAVYSDSTLIFDKKWTNFDSEVFLFGEQSSLMNMDSTMKDGSHSFNPAVGSGSGSSSIIHNNDHNNVENRVMNVEPANDEDLNSCMDQVEIWSKMAMKAYKERESALQQSVQLNHASFQQQINQRDEVIASLRKENEQNKLRIHQLERQLFEKELLVMSYRGRLRDVSVKSEEYYRPISLQQQLHNNMTPPHLNINGRWSAGGGASVRSRGNDSAPIVID